jgi:hypothetical protein
MHGRRMAKGQLGPAMRADVLLIKIRKNPFQHDKALLFEMNKNSDNFPRLSCSLYQNVRQESPADAADGFASEKTDLFQIVMDKKQGGKQLLPGLL